jgi:hypothetical protein
VAIYHCATKPLGRSSGRSAVAAAAYRAGARLRDERQGMEHDYTRRQGVLHTELVLPEGAGAWTRAALWNAAEQAEKRKDSRTAREWEIALPEELDAGERQQLAVRFARGLASKYGCAVDVALHEADREGDQRNWHAHLLTTTRRVVAGGLGDKCAIELSDAKRLSLGLAPARMEVEAVRQMWAQEVNRELEAARSPERVDHRSLAAQWEEALQKGDQAKAAELDRAPQVKLGWKVVQMERRGEASDRGVQLRQVKAENAARKAVVLDIRQLRQELGERRQAEALRREQAEQQKLLGQVEQELLGKSRMAQESVLSRWRHLASLEVPDVAHARALWEQDQFDGGAKAWRETRRTIEWESRQIAESEQAIANWHRVHPVQSLALRTGLLRTPASLRQLIDQRATNARFLEASHEHLREQEQTWDTRQRVAYQQQLEALGAEIQQARKYVRVIERNAEHIERVREREDRAYRQAREQRRERSRERDRGWGGWGR